MLWRSSLCFCVVWDLVLLLVRFGYVGCFIYVGLVLCLSGFVWVMFGFGCLCELPTVLSHVMCFVLGCLMCAGFVCLCNYLSAVLFLAWVLGLHLGLKSDLLVTCLWVCCCMWL